MSTNHSTLATVRENASTDIYLQFYIVWTVFYVGFAFVHVLGGGPRPSTLS